MSFKDTHPKTGMNGYSNNASRDDASSRGRTRSRSGPYYRAYPTSDGTKVEYSNDDEEALQEIDKDITRIWRELQELDGMAPGRNEQPTNSNHQKHHNQDRVHIQPKNTPSSTIPGPEPKKKYETVTVREFTMPTPVSASPTRIRSISSSAAHSNVSKDGNKEKQADAMKTDGKQRTIWDMYPSEPLDPNHIPNYSSPIRRGRDPTQRSGLMKPTWRRSLSGSRNPYEEHPKNGNPIMSTSLINDAPVHSQAFATPFGTNITPTPIRRPQLSNRQSPSPQRPPSSSSFIPATHSSSATNDRSKTRSDIPNNKTALQIDISVQPLQQR